MSKLFVSTPPMGWNSFDAFGSSVTEEQFRENVDFIADHLMDKGWTYVVVDYCWSHPDPGPVENPFVEYDQEGLAQPSLSMDEYGRLLPSEKRFPSASGGKGFAPLAEYVHSKGLKFGIHIMRGIPREAVHRNLPVLGTSICAGEIGDKNSKCRWLNHMYGLDMKKEGSQAYYDSIFELYKSWGVDFVKADDLTNLHPYPDLDPAFNQYAKEEITGISRAMERCGRPMVLSVSCGPTPLFQADHVAKYTHMWRMTADFWDRWDDLKEMFYYCRAWNPHMGEGCWPDADMIPFGRLSKCGPYGDPRDSRLTIDEKNTLMALWALSRSPLMLGGNLPEYDDHSMSLICNRELLNINQHSSHNREFFNDGETIIWSARVKEKLYCGLFNTGEEERDLSVPLVLYDGMKKISTIHDVINRGVVSLGSNGRITVPAHGVRLLGLS
jgi:alpha-galactosidase